MFRCTGGLSCFCVALLDRPDKALQVAMVSIATCCLHATSACLLKCLIDICCLVFSLNREMWWSACFYVEPHLLSLSVTRSPLSLLLLRFLLFISFVPRPSFIPSVCMYSNTSAPSVLDRLMALEKLMMGCQEKDKQSMQQSRKEIEVHRLAI